MALMARCPQLARAAASSSVVGHERVVGDDDQRPSARASMIEPARRDTTSAADRMCSSSVGANRNHSRGELPVLLPGSPTAALPTFAAAAAAANPPSLSCISIACSRMSATPFVVGRRLRSRARSGP